MRLDLFLKVSGLIRKRTLARSACTSGLVQVNGTAAKPGRQVQEGDRLTIAGQAQGDGVGRTVEILALPRGQVSRRDRRGLYEILEESRDDHLH